MRAWEMYYKKRGVANLVGRRDNQLQRLLYLREEFFLLLEAESCCVAWDDLLYT